MTNYLNNMEAGNAYVMSLKKLANIIYYEMNNGDVFSFGTEWTNEDEFVMSIEETFGWHGIYKIASPFEGGVNFIILGKWASKKILSFAIEYEDIDDIIENLRIYIRDYADDTTINGYVCFDPENLRKDKKEK